MLFRLPSSSRLPVFSDARRKPGILKERTELFGHSLLDYLVIRSWSFTLLSTGKIENPDGDASADEGNKKKLALQETEKRKNLIPFGTQA